MYNEENNYSPRRGRKNSKSKKGLSGTEETQGNSNKKSLATELSKPLFVVGGLLVGNLIGKGIDKMVTVSTDATKFEIKSIIKPIVQAGMGVGIIMLARDKGKETKGIQTIKEVARSLGYGVAGSGVISTVKLINKDLFAGLGNPSDPSERPIEAKYYREAKDEIMQLLQDNSFRPALPEARHNNISAPPFEQEAEEQYRDISGTGETEEAEII